MTMRDPKVDPFIAPYLKRQVVELEVAHPVRVQIVSPPKKSTTLAQRIGKGMRDLWRDRMLLVAVTVLLLLLIVTLWLWNYYIYFEETPPIGSEPTGLDFAIRYSPWLSVGDEETLTLTLINNGTTELTEVRACLAFLDAVPVETPKDSSNAVTFGDLGVGERKTRTIPILLTRRIDSEVRTELRVTSGEFSEAELDKLSFRVVPIPHIKGGLRWFGSIFLLGLSALISRLFAGILKAK